MEKDEKHPKWFGKRSVAATPLSPGLRAADGQRGGAAHGAELGARNDQKTKEKYEKHEKKGEKKGEIWIEKMPF